MATKKTTSKPQRGHVVLFTGRKQAGKNTAAQHFIDQGYIELSFAKPIKRIVLTLDPIIASEMSYTLDDGSRVARNGLVRLSEFIKAGYTLDELKESHTEVRRLLQVTGTEVGREIDPDLWVNETQKIIEAAPELNYVITDGRFANEVDMVHGIGGDSVFVQSNKAEALPVRHESELYAGTLGEKFTVSNNGSIGELLAQVNGIFGGE